MVKITNDLLKENFPNTYLEQVAFEVRFPADLTIKNKIPEFQGIIKDNFNAYNEAFSLKVPFQPDLEKSNLLDYSFLNEKDGLELYLNTYSIFGLRTRKYSNFETFSKIFLENLKLFINMCKINSISRLGIRYVNIIPLEEDKNKSVQLKNNYFNSLIKDEYNYSNSEDQQIYLRYYDKNYEIREQFIFRKTPTNFYNVVIDFDNSYKRLIKIEYDNITEIEKMINDLHDLIKKKFFDIIKDSFLNKLREKKGEHD